MSHDFPTSKHETRIEDVPPKRNRDFADLLHALFAVLVGAAVILFSIYLHGTTSGVESDVRSAGHVVSWLMDVPTSLLQQIAIVFITVSVLIQLLIAKEWAAKCGFRHRPYSRFHCDMGHIRSYQRLGQ